jgi:hypothetical protein
MSTGGENPEPELAPAAGVEPDGPLPPGTAPMSETAADIQDLDVDSPRVAILMGSESDMPAMEKAEQELTKREILSETRVMSAHRQPDIVADYAKNAKLRGIRVIIAGAGLSAALPGVVAAHTDLPVIGVPLTSRTSASTTPATPPCWRRASSTPEPFAQALACACGAARRHDRDALHGRGGIDTACHTARFAVAGRAGRSPRPDRECDRRRGWVYRGDRGRCVLCDVHRRCGGSAGGHGRTPCAPRAPVAR